MKEEFSLTKTTETSSLPSLGVVTPSTTSNTNLSLLTQSQRHDELSSRGKETCSPRPQRQILYLLQVSLLHRLPRIPTFLCSLKVKVTANRVVGDKGHEPCGPRDRFSTFFRSHNSIDYLEYQPFFAHSKSKARRIE